MVSQKGMKAKSKHKVENPDNSRVRQKQDYKISRNKASM
jgi:hypothetical protein